MNKNNVVILEIAGKGGICHYTYNLSKALSAIANITLVTAKNYELKDKIDKFEVIGLLNHFRTNPFFIFSLMKILRQRNVKIVHFQLSQHPILILFISFILKYLNSKKIIITAHNVLSHESKMWERKIYSALYSLANAIIVHAYSNKKEMLSEFRGVYEGKIKVIPHGNYMFFNEVVDGHVKLNDEKIILFFGYIRKYKGLDVLLDALKKIKEAIPDVKLVIAGKPVENFSQYRNKIKALGLDDNIELDLSYISFEKVKEYFSRAAVVTMPYEKIYQSGVLQLAYGFGKPVVVTDTGGMPEVVEAGENGYIVPVGDSGELAEKVQIILNDKMLQEKMGKRSLELAKTRFNWETIAEKTVLIYQELEKI